MPAHRNGPLYRKKIGRHAQALWIIPEAYGTGRVRDDVRAYTSRALKARKTPMLVVYGIPGRDCGSHSSPGSLHTAAQYRAWIAQVGKGLKGQKALVVLEPDALPLFSSDVHACPTERAGWQGMLRYATSTLSRAGAWVYLDAGHSDWTPLRHPRGVPEEGGRPVRPRHQHERLELPPHRRREGLRQGSCWAGCATSA